MIQNARVKLLNSNHIQDGKYVLYWMQSAQRTDFNHALEYAIEEANRLEKPLLVYFGIDSNFPEATERSYQFMLQGLHEVSKKLTDRGIAYQFGIESPPTGVKRLSDNAVMIVVDRAYQKLQRSWRKEVSKTVKCPFVQVETNVVVPVETAYSKEAYSAGILRPKIHQHLDEFLTPVSERILEKSLTSPPEESIDLANIADVLDRIKVNEDVKPVKEIEGGSEAARMALLRFIQTKLDAYPEDSNDPGKDNLSGLSPYLHFGQISPLEVALAILESDSSGSEVFLEQLIVRRELSMNFVYYNDQYDSYRCLPEWAQKTLQNHLSDKRDYVYSLSEFEKAETHDSYWNAAQIEMLRTGSMHNYMRMYWGKKILEWCKTPKKAYEIALYLNNKYELDGRDPNGYAGIAWCFGKHDRAWSERPIFGKVRYMNSRGLERKFDMDKYVKRVNAR
ncbi:MAG: deoxyribodipyrimidine photo-lyase [Candidatus Thorarchaeota archaeon]|nr:deoxyribodipyrimidine photo-lyase [Candidatus Thorarchaeota archaeon]